MIRRSALAVAALLAATPAFAHLDPVEHGSFAAGLSHPLTGPDHILAMVAVGLWAAIAGGEALWRVPAAFVAAMAAGFAAAVSGMQLPFVEPAILASVVAIGLLAALAAPIPGNAAAGVVGFFAFFHGHAHGGEMGSAELAPYAAGFILATALLHLAGIVLAAGSSRVLDGGKGRALARGAGALAALGGLALAAGA
jgi:urease accessory protein